MCSHCLAHTEALEAVNDSFYRLTVKERDYERVRADRFERERDEARAEVERLRAVVKGDEKLLGMVNAEVMRLQAAIRSAPHDDWCPARSRGCWNMPPPELCNCWKAAALKEVP